MREQSGESSRSVAGFHSKESNKWFYHWGLRLDADQEGRAVPEKEIPWEDHLLERKTDRDLKDIRRTAVAFANSVRPDHTAVILVGEGNEGIV